MSPDGWAILLLMAGMALIIAEVFIPSGGLISVAAAIALVLSLVCAWWAWYARLPLYFWGFVVFEAGMLPITISVALWIWPNTPIGRKAILQAPLAADSTAFPDESAKIQSLVGKSGKTDTILNPAGMMKLDGLRLHCQSEGMIIESGAPVTVVSVQGQRLIVRRSVLSVEHPEPAKPNAAKSSESTRASDPLLDFELE